MCVTAPRCPLNTELLPNRPLQLSFRAFDVELFKEQSHFYRQCQSGFPRQSTLLLFILFILFSLKLVRNMISR